MSKLYTPGMLALTTELAHYPLIDDFALSAQGRSSVCGSTLKLGADVSGEGAVERIGLSVSACAVGQASAAIMAGAIRGACASDLERALGAIQDWLAGGASLPDWPRFEALEGALAHPGRHGALLLPWETASRALSSTKSADALSSRAAAR